jgi:predicted hotdog family 3-hydroxylacyl-ACP dehydratase
LFGLGRKLDLTGKEAMRLGDIATVRSVEYHVNSFHGWGRECVTARGE